MLRKITYNSVNWVDGMKISKEHFVHMENNVFDYIRDANAVRLNSFNYGILPPHPESADNSSLKYNLVIDRNGLMKIDIFECRALTPAGTRIEITSSDAFGQQKSLVKEVNLLEFGTTNFFIVVSSNPFERQPCGQPDQAESPPRIPYAIPSLNVEVVPVENYKKMTSGPFHVAIAKIKYTNTRVFEEDKEYIPPMCTIKSSHELIEIHGQLDEVFCRIELLAVEIIKKIYKKEQNTEVARSVLYLCEKVMDFLGANITYFRCITGEMPPIYMVEFLMRFARVIKNAIDVKEGTGREQMLNYFKDWIMEVKQGEFNTVVENLTNCEYQHWDINQNINEIQGFTLTIKTIFDKLNKLDYIGDRKKGVELTKKTVDVGVKQDESPKRRNFMME